MRHPKRPFHVERGQVKNQPAARTLRLVAPRRGQGTAAGVLAIDLGRPVVVRGRWTMVGLRAVIEQRAAR